MVLHSTKARLIGYSAPTDQDVNDKKYIKFSNSQDASRPCCTLTPPTKELPTLDGANADTLEMAKTKKADVATVSFIV